MADPLTDYSELSDPAFRAKLRSNPLMAAYYSGSVGKKQSDRAARIKREKGQATYESRRNVLDARQASNYQRNKDWNDYVASRSYENRAPSANATLEDVKMADYYRVRKKEIENKYGWNDSTTIDDVFAPDREAAMQDAASEAASQEALRDREYEQYSARKKRQVLSGWGQTAPQQIPPQSMPVVEPASSTAMPREPEIQINPRTNFPKPSITITPPSLKEEAEARRNRVMDAAHINSVLSLMNAREEEMNTAIEKNPWLGGGYSVKPAQAQLDIPSREEAAIREAGVFPTPRPAPLPKSQAQIQAEESMKEWSGSKIAPKETIDALRAQEPTLAQTEFKAPRIESAPKFTDEELRETQTERQPGPKNYRDERNLRYRMALAGRYGSKVAGDSGYR
jgi:hypothetical protein